MTALVQSFQSEICGYILDHLQDGNDVEGQVELGIWLHEHNSENTIIRAVEGNIVEMISENMMLLTEEERYEAAWARLLTSGELIKAVMRHLAVEVGYLTLRGRERRRADSGVEV